MIKISAVIITLNEEINLERCLQSVLQVADEIVVVDSFSTDATVDIANKYGAKVVLQKFLGHIEQKNFAAYQASNDWILSLDADEALSEQLRANISAIKNNPEKDAYKFARLNNFCGKWIKHSGWYPDAKIRLFNRTKGQWSGQNPHDKWELSDKTQKEGYLKGDLLHYSFYTISDYVKKIERYTEISAHAAVAKGKTASILKIVVVPEWSFFVNYIIRLGFLDGYSGYMVCKLMSYEKKIKYAKIREYNVKL